MGTIKDAFLQGVGSAIGGLPSTAIQFGSNALASAIQWRRSREAANVQNKRNIEQWQRETALNLPSTQMALLKQAGINPNLVAGLNGMSVPSAPSMVGADADFSPVAAPAGMSPSQLDALNSETLLNEQNIQRLLIENNWRDRNFGLRYEIGSQTLSNMRQEGDVLTQTICNLQKEGALKDIQISREQIALDIEEQTKGIKVDTAKKEYDILCKEYERTIEEIKNLAEQRKLYKTQEAYYTALSTKIEQETINLSKQAELLDIEISAADRENLAAEADFNVDYDAGYKDENGNWHYHLSKVGAIKYTLNMLKGLVSFSASSGTRSVNSTSSSTSSSTSTVIRK
ncbi:minor capsid protein [Capybara microvirus Cap1_SP_61]|nr:minor capsid protein [Capybara microvirus Cap1_SP_61]